MNVSAAIVPEQRRRLLFVDDEKRVLTSMRALFRRDYDVLLANSGAEALELLGTARVDVIVSDQRMPEMTGVELLSEFKRRSPDTTRILLTGYADLQAIEDSINECEVFRYLMKPCAAEELRAAVREALTTEAIEIPKLSPRMPEKHKAYVPREFEVGHRQVHHADDSPAYHQPCRDAEPWVCQGDASEGATTADEPPVVIENQSDVAIMVLTTDNAFLRSIEHAVRGAFSVVSACSIADASSALASSNVGVLVTDTVTDEHDVEVLIRRLRASAPNLVLVVASDRSDASMLVDLINHAQVFRFLLKPVQGGQCRIWLTSAVNKYLTASEGNGKAHTEPGSSLGARVVGWFNSLVSQASA